MSSSPTVTLFTQQIDPSRRPLALLVSTLIHGAAFALVSFGVLYIPKVDARGANHYMVRKLELHRSNAPPPRAARGIAYPAQARHGSPARSATASDSALRLAVQAQAGAQTLLQPDLAKRLAQNEEVPVPQVLIWTPSRVVAKTIVPPAPEQPTAADARPTLDAPNAEINLSDVELASSRIPSEKTRILPSTTSPVVVHGANLAQLPPASTSQVAARPTPAAILALSDTRMKDGTAYLPPLNETVKASGPGSLAPGPAANGSTGGQDKAGAGSVAGPGTGAAQGTATVSGPEGRPGGSVIGPSQGADAGSIQGDPAGTTRITLPKNGQFGAIVVGSALEDQYPEMAGVWNGRMAYTVYLHVGLSRSWILQYALPRSADAAAAGNTDRLDAPWPYSIVRPNLASGAVDAEALMVHGFVNQSGRFEALTIVFPEDFRQAQFVLSSLDKWQFRPALQGGKVARVEVLLIIPEELD